MHRMLLVIAVVLLAAGAAQASWAQQHLNRAWAGELSRPEVEELSAGLETIDLTKRDDAWSVILLAIHFDARGQFERSCPLVARFDDLKKWKRELRLEALRGACLLQEGRFAEAALAAKGSARKAAMTEPADFPGILLRAHEVHGTAMVGQLRASPEDGKVRGQTKKALAAWEAVALEHHDMVKVIEARTHLASLP